MEFVVFNVRISHPSFHHPCHWFLGGQLGLFIEPSFAIVTDSADNIVVHWSFPIDFNCIRVVLIITTNSAVRHTALDLSDSEVRTFIKTSTYHQMHSLLLIIHSFEQVSRVQVTYLLSRLTPYSIVDWLTASERHRLGQTCLPLTNLQCVIVGFLNNSPRLLLRKWYPDKSMPFAVSYCQGRTVAGLHSCWVMVVLHLNLPGQSTLLFPCDYPPLSHDPALESTLSRRYSFELANRAWASFYLNYLAYSVRAPLAFLWFRCHFPLIGLSWTSLFWIIEDRHPSIS